MGRRVSVGIATPGGNTGLISVDANTIASVETNANLTLDPNGTGNVVALSNLELRSQSDLRLFDMTSTGYAAIQAYSVVASNYTLTLPPAQNPKNLNGLIADTSGNLTWSPMAYTYSVKTTSFAAEHYEAYFVDTSAGGVTMTLPSSPSMGTTIRVIDVAKTFNSNAFTVARNGQLIMGDAADMTVSTEAAAFDLIYSNSTYGWRIFSI